MHTEPTAGRRFSPTRWLSGSSIALLVVLVLSASPLRAADPTKADTSSRARRDSIASIPFNKLDHDARKAGRDRRRR